MKDWTLLGIIIGIVVILGICFCEQIYLENLSDEMVNDVKTVEMFVNSGNIEEGFLRLQDSIKKWEKRQKILEIMINHEDIHKISYSLIEINSKLKSFLPSDNVSPNFALLKEYIKSIKEGNEFTINNVL